MPSSLDSGVCPRFVPAPPSSLLVAAPIPVDTRGQRNSVGGMKCKSIENQGPEAVHEGDLYVRREEGTVCGMRALSGEAEGR